MTTLRIAPKPTGRGAIVELDGHDIADAVTHLTLIGDGREPQRLLLQLDLPINALDVEGVTVEVIEPVRDILVRLGWTPPQAEPVEVRTEVKLDGKAIHEATLDYKRRKGLLE